MEGITDADYAHAKTIYEDFEIKENILYVMLLIVAKGITGGIYRPIYQYAKANNK